MARFQISPRAWANLRKLIARRSGAGVIAWTDAVTSVAEIATERGTDERVIARIIADELRIEQLPADEISREQIHTLLRAEDLCKVTVADWRAMQAVPVELDDTTVTVAFTNPLDNELRSSIEFELGRTVVPMVAEESLISRCLATDDVPQGEIDRLVRDEPRVKEAVSPVRLESTIGSADPASPPVVKLVDKIFYEAIARGASDIHLTPEADRMLVRVRVDGVVRELFSIPAALSLAVLSRVKLMAEMDIAERRRPQDGRIRYRAGDVQRDVRISTMPVAHGENLVARILSNELAEVSLGGLGVAPRELLVLRRLLSSPSGVVLVSGPTGSGKTSTLYAGLLELRDGATNILTIEDPIEYRLPGITQTQVNSKAGFGFAEGLRSALRQDPDIILIGEIRDGETAQIALQAAQTGHLVLSTIHTTSAAGAVTRLRDLGVPSYLIASAQRLVRTVCGACKAGNEARRSCSQCEGNGYRGRTAIYSILEVNDAVRELIRNDASEGAVEAAATGSGFASLHDASAEIVASGRTTQAEVDSVLGVREQPVTLTATRLPAEAESIARHRVLLVDDDDNIRTVLAMVLERDLFEVIQAGNGREALQQVFASPPDVILCDLMMPDIDGLGVVQRLRADPRTAEIPILMLTANDTEENEHRLIVSGANDFLSKTTNPKIILARVQRLLS